MVAGSAAGAGISTSIRLSTRVRSVLVNFQLNGFAVLLYRSTKASSVDASSARFAKLLAR